MKRLRDEGHSVFQASRIAYQDSSPDPCGTRVCPERLVSMILSDLTTQEKEFIVSVKEGTPKWELLGLEGIEHLPAVRWKLLNIGKMKPSKHKEAVRKLRNYLGV